jgi:hypothetical protein
VLKVDWASFWIGVAIGFCIVLGIPWLLYFVVEAYERMEKWIKGGEKDMVEKITEKSNYRVEDEAGNVLRAKFKDLHDAHEWSVNQILAGKSKVVIKAEIVIERAK